MTLSGRDAYRDELTTLAAEDPPWSAWRRTWAARTTPSRPRTRTGSSTWGSPRQP
ncbi:hypothetical protein ACFQ3Z_24770 [Streptomyces nogalater]